MEKQKEILKKTNITISKNLKKLDSELDSLNKEFNWLMRQHYQESQYFLGNVNNGMRHKKLDNISKLNVNEKVDKKKEYLNVRNSLDLSAIHKVEYNIFNKTKKLNSKIKKKKKKRNIIWNAWVVDTSSESESISN